VADLTRLATLEEAILRQERIARGHEKAAPFVLALNKSDLSEKEFDEAEARRAVGDWQIVCTSAKTGESVKKMFEVVVDALFKQFGLPPRR
jgi:50S ribosomal subunit-associated GTPase HflX